MKRITALLVVAALAISMFPLAAFAKSEAHEGMYGGYYYTATLTSSKTSATTRMTYTGSTKIHSIGSVTHKTPSGATTRSPLSTTPQTSSASVTLVTSNITSVTQTYYVSNTAVTTIAFNVN